MSCVSVAIVYQDRNKHMEREAVPPSFKVNGNQSDVDTPGHVGYMIGSRRADLQL